MPCHIVGRLVPPSPPIPMSSCALPCFSKFQSPSQEGSGIRCPECFTLFLFESVQSVPLYEVEADGVAEEPTATAGLQEGGGAGLGLRNGEGQLR